MATRVFYAWQSDRDSRTCRNVIEKAAERAIEQLSVNTRLEDAPDIELDRDTQGEPGTPHIAETIQQKIRRCGVFLADVTFVSEYEASKGRKKKTPNSNVLIELGLAIRSVGWSRILLVMNTQYGEPADLPFDLKHHCFPIQYRLAVGDDVKVVRRKLADVLFTKLDDILKSGVIEASRTGKIETKIKCWKDNREGMQHCRWLHVDVVNHGVGLNNVYATLDYPGKDSQMIQWGFEHFGKITEPFAKGHSFRFGARNDDPSKQIEALADLNPEQISVVVHSHVREMVRIPATKWLKELDAFRKSDPTMPPKPPPQTQPRRDQIDFSTMFDRHRDNYRKW